MSHFEVTLQHNDETITALSRMQYDLFSRKNRIINAVICVTCVIIGIQNFTEWWGIFLTACGCFMVTGTYNFANHKAKKLIRQFRESGEDYPASRYIFDEKQFRVLSLPEQKQLSSIAYSEVLKMGEDRSYLYIFPNEYGGYMISKQELDPHLEEFRSFITAKTGKTIYSRKSLFQRLMEWYASKKK